MKLLSMLQLLFRGITPLSISAIQNLGTTYVSVFFVIGDIQHVNDSG